MPISSLDALAASYDVLVVGAGPAGLACALRCRQRGLKTLLLEAGGERPIRGYPDVIAADLAEPAWHDPVDITSAAALGGTSHWWGGGCVPFDPADFRDWPLSYDDMLSWYAAAGDFLGAKGVHEGPAPGSFAKLKRFDATRDETWCPQVNMAKRWKRALRAPEGPIVVMNARVTGLVHERGRIGGVRVRVSGGDRIAHAGHVVLACGGLGSVRLLLLAQRETPALFGGAEGLLGAGYMGHLAGTISDMAPSQLSDAEAFAFRDLGGDIYARRRITAREATVAQDNIANIAFWIDNAFSHNPAHQSPVASAKHVAARLARQLANRGPRENADLAPHLENISRAPVTAAAGVAHAISLSLAARLRGRKPRPSRFVPASDGAWLLRYHAEQRPSPSNRLRLSEKNLDSVGLPHLDISFCFSTEDCERVVRAHELLHADLQAAGAGRLRWHAPLEQCADLVKISARDGYHQLGGAAMSADPRKGIVDSDCRVRGLENLWIASSCTFPTGGQANPTLTIVALACRLAERLARAPSAA